MKGRSLYGNKQTGARSFVETVGHTVDWSTSMLGVPFLAAAAAVVRGAGPFNVDVDATQVSSGDDIWPNFVG